MTPQLLTIAYKLGARYQTTTIDGRNSPLVAKPTRYET